ncbi:MAG TPA: DUF3025 domain-containing protein [Burkholderiales bacterium]|nr:DUF3025 domain-containing protein [Burkholderiales bacterium]
MLAPLAAAAELLRGCRDWPARDALQRILTERAVRTAGGDLLRLVAPGGTDRPYEQRIRTDGEMPVRERDWHDLFNVLVWATYPRAKAALNDAHVTRDQTRIARRCDSLPDSERGAIRDALTLFDENGAIVLSSDGGLLDDLRAFRWKRLFQARREEVKRTMRFYLFGHALFEKALRPYIGMTAHAILLEMDPKRVAAPAGYPVNTLDDLVAEAVSTLDAPRALAPLPVLGVPGWWPENERAEFYDNEAYFRTGRRGVSRPPR